MAETQPDLSVVIVTRDTYESIRRVIGKLRAQTVRARIELVIVAPSATTLVPDAAALEAFMRHVVVEIGAIKSRGRAAAHGVRRASAPIVAFIENHSFPDAEWAAELLAAHRGPWAAVGPAVKNANAETARSWATFFLAYGEYAFPRRSGEAPALPHHNSSYKRSLLLALGDELDHLLDSEGHLQARLRQEGHKFFLQGSATTSHLNPAVLGTTLHLRFVRGRLFAADRSRNWSLARRLLYVAGAPLIPIMNFAPVIRNVRRIADGRPSLSRLLPVLALYTGAAAVGEVMGYLAGSGRGQEFSDEYEFMGAEREAHARPAR